MLRVAAKTPISIALLLALPVTGCCTKCRSAATSILDGGANAATGQSVPIPPGQDTAPSRWSTAEQSRNGRPAWSSDPSFAPQLPERDKRRVFDIARAEATQSPTQASEPTLMICRIEYKGSPDTGLKALIAATAPDLNVQLAAGSLPAISTRGPEDSHVAFMTVPLFTLSPTDSMVFHLFDRDADSVEDLGTLTVPSPRFPVEIERDLTSIDCRLLSKARVEQLASEQLRQVDKELAAVAAPAPLDPQDSTFGLVPQRRTMREAIETMAAVVGGSQAQAFVRCKSPLSS